MRQPKISSKLKKKLSPSDKITLDINEGLRLQRSLRSSAYSQYLSKHRSDLPWFWRSFSLIAQRPSIESFSNYLEDYITRPLYLLSASSLCLIGLAIYVFTAKHYGFSYNYWFGIIFFGMGYVFGLLTHLLIKLISWIFR